MTNDPRAMSESALRSALIQAASVMGWRVYSIPDWIWAVLIREAKKRGWAGSYEWPDSGFPDLFLAKGGRFVYAELKSATGDVTDDQHEWLEELAAGPCEVYVVYPEDEDWFIGVLRDGPPEPVRSGSMVDA